MALGTAVARLFVQHVLSRVFAAGGGAARDRRILEAASVLSPPPRGTRVRPTQLAGRDAEWVDARRPGSRSRATILYLHGGGFVAGSCGTHRALAAHISRAADARVLLPDYPLAPEHPYPAAERWCLEGYRGLVERGAAASELLLGGDSAGGYLALQTLLRARDARLPRPAAAFLISPLADAVYLDGDSLASRARQDPWLTRGHILRTLDCYLGGREERGRELCPLRADLSGLPPVRIDVGDDEILLSDAVRLAERLEAADVPVQLRVWPRMWHVFPAFATFVPEARQAIAQIGAFCRAHNATGRR